MTTAAHVSAVEAEKYGRVWAMREYRTKHHGVNLWRERPDLFTKPFASAIDIGCGLGLLLPAFAERGAEPFGVDIVPDVSLNPAVKARYGRSVYASSLWSFDPGRVFDLGVCTDVMEHIPEPYVRPTLARMSKYCRRVVFKTALFAGSTWRALKPGEALHLTVRPPAFWHAVTREAMGGTVNDATRNHERSKYAVYTWEPAP